MRETLDRAAIAGLIPHAGAMCLLDAVVRWNESEIECRSETHCDVRNPLREDGALAAVHLVEYGAQAMAVHGGLLERAAGRAARPGVLATLRDVELAVARLDQVKTPLVVRARRLLANDQGLLYAFEAESAGRTLGHGRVGVIHVDATPT